MKIEVNKRIKIQNPIGRPEKISKKNPPQTAPYKPEGFSGFRKRFIKITEIKTRLGIIPEILK